MKKFIYLAILVLIINYVFSQNNDYTIVTEEWAPYNYMENNKLTGLSTEIVISIMAKLNVNYNIEFLPSMRTTKALQTQPHTIMFSMFKTLDRKDKYKWVGPLVEDSISLYKRKNDNTIYKNYDDLNKAKRIACRNAGLITNLLLSNGFNNLDMSATDAISIYMKLIQNRCDLAISDTDLGVKYAMSKIGHDIAEIEKVPIEIFRSELYIAFSYDCDDILVNKWQKALDSMKLSGEIKSIINKYK